MKQRKLEALEVVTEDMRLLEKKSSTHLVSIAAGKGFADAKTYNVWVCLIECTTF